MAHEPLTEKVAELAAHMVQQQHFARDKVTEELQDLQERLHLLKEATQTRKARLHNSLELHKVQMQLGVSFVLLACPTMYQNTEVPLKVVSCGVSFLFLIG